MEELVASSLGKSGRLILSRQEYPPMIGSGWLPMDRKQFT
jgi:hypothetical protein